MKRNLLSFLDLVTLFLMAMIVITSVSAGSPAGVGRAKPPNKWEVVEVEGTVTRQDFPIAWSEDPSAAGVAVVFVPSDAGPPRCFVYVSARSYMSAEIDRTKVHVIADFQVKSVRVMSSVSPQWRNVEVADEDTPRFAETRLVCVVRGQGEER